MSRPRAKRRRANDDIDQQFAALLSDDGLIRKISALSSKKRVSEKRRCSVSNTASREESSKHEVPVKPRAKLQDKNKQSQYTGPGAVVWVRWRKEWWPAQVVSGSEYTTATKRVAGKDTEVYVKYYAETKAQIQYECVSADRVTPFSENREERTKWWHAKKPKKILRQAEKDFTVQDDELLKLTKATSSASPLSRKKISKKKRVNSDLLFTPLPALSEQQRNQMQTFSVCVAPPPPHRMRLAAGDVVCYWDPFFGCHEQGRRVARIIEVDPTSEHPLLLDNDDLLPRTHFVEKTTGLSTVQQVLLRTQPDNESDSGSESSDESCRQEDGKQQQQQPLEPVVQATDLDASKTGKRISPNRHLEAGSAEAALSPSADPPPQAIGNLRRSKRRRIGESNGISRESAGQLTTGQEDTTQFKVESHSESGQLQDLHAHCNGSGERLPVPPPTSLDVEGSMQTIESFELIPSKLQGEDGLSLMKRFSRDVTTSRKETARRYPAFANMLLRKNEQSG